MGAIFTPDVQIFFILLAALFFVISFFSPKVGLIIMTLAMLFSPEIPIGAFEDRSIIIRVEDILIPILLLAWLAQLAVRREFNILKITPLNRPIGLLFLLILVSTVWGLMMGYCTFFKAFFYIFKTLEFFIIFFIVLNYIKDMSQIHFFLFFILLTAAFIGVYTLMQVPSAEIFSEHRITAPFEGTPESSTIGGYMAFLILLLFSIFLYESHKVKKWLCGLIAALTFIPFLYTFNRSSYIALIGGVLVIAFLSRKKWLMITVLLLAVSSPIWAPQGVKSRIAFTWEDAANPGRVLGVDASFQERIYSFKRMWNGFRFSPIIGWGVGSFDYPDNQYARTLYELGVIGLGIWLWIFLRLFKISRWLFDALEPGTIKGLVLGYCAGILGILLHACGSTTFYVVRIMEPFWFVSGLVVAVYVLKLQEDGHPTA